MIPRILIVDNATEVVAALVEFFELKTDWLVRTTGDGAEAWEMLQRFRFDLVQVEYLLSFAIGINGLELCCLIKRHIPGTKVVFASSWITQDEAFAFGADVHFTKPFQLVDYLVILKKLLGLHS